jgi:hypothetical protein
MNKLTALSKLASAYHDQFAQPTDTQDTLDVLNDKFGYIRRSLSIEDLKPQPKCTEGLNPAGPKFF